jgi:hypothetical protein
MNDYKFLLESDIPDCSKACLRGDVTCPIKDCRQWIDYKKDLNCTAIAVKKNGSMSLREVADRMHVSFVRIKQVEDKALIKIKKRLAKRFNFRGEELREFLLSAFGAYSGKSSTKGCDHDTNKDNQKQE